MVIDLHTHVLPQMDDGSKSVAQSVQMLRSMKKDGIDAVGATPHYYGFREGIAPFCQRRDQALAQLREAADETCPRLLPGAEVAYFSQLPDLGDLHPLCYEGTDTLLLEMPFRAWSGMEFLVLSKLCLDLKYHVILAHIERFIPYQKDRTILEKVLSLPLWTQVNAEALLPLSGRKHILSLLSSGSAKLLGSDCHNMDSRAPNLRKGREIVQKKLGQTCLDEIDRCGAQLLFPENKGGSPLG